MLAQVNGTELFYTTTGHGIPMLVMHGGLGFDHTYYRPWLDELGDIAEITYYDHRGNGRSARPSSWEGITHATWADDADALRERLGHEKIVLLGHSYGGFLAMEYALRHGEHLAGLILSCTAPALDYPEIVMANAQARGTAEQVAALQAGLANPTSDDAEMRALIGQIIDFYFVNPDPAITGAIDAGTIYSGPAFHHAFANCLPTWSLVGKLGAIDAPTLILAGRQDWITPPAQGAERIAAEIPQARLVIFEHSGHFPFIEEKPKFMATMRDWLGGLG